MGDAKRERALVAGDTTVLQTGEIDCFSSHSRAEQSTVQYHSVTVTAIITITTLEAPCVEVENVILDEDDDDDDASDSTT